MVHQGEPQELKLYSFVGRTDILSLVEQEECTTSMRNGVYEYLFSDHAATDSTMWSTPYIDIYMGAHRTAQPWLYSAPVRQSEI